MSLQSALVDTARTIRRAPTGPKVAGETPYGPFNGDNFKCRVSSPSANELRTDKLEFVEYTRDATMIVGMKDLTGDSVDILETDKIDVVSGVFAGTYEVMGEPTPIRKKVTQIGWQMALRKYEGKDA